jgi:putative PIN family toxin of toxin-antitoxin system
VEVVLDVNVFVSAVLSGAGPSAQLVTAMRDDRLSVVACPALVTELASVLRRDRFRRYLSLEEVDEYAGEIEALCRMVDDPDPVPAVLRDPDDDYLVALASESGAEAIVSGDLDLHEATGLSVDILSPWEALTRLAG